MRQHIIVAALATAAADILPGALHGAAGRGQLGYVAEFAGPKSFAAGFANSVPDIVHGKFDDQLDTVGWTYLDLATNASYSDLQQAYAAGYAEGAATVQRTWQSFLNAGVVNATLPAPVVAWLDNNTAFVHGQILAHLNDPYWHQITLLLAQVQGLADGYADFAPPAQSVPESAFTLVEIGGDLDDLMWLASDAELEAVGAAHSQYGRVRRHAQHRARRAAAAAAGTPVPPLTDSGHCSAVVRYLSAGEGAAAPELYSSQVTWSSFESMLRVYKTYDMPFTVDGRPGSPTVPNRVVSFSGYPGTVSSGDDWYVLSPSGLVALETTIGNNNNTLYALYMLPASVLEWARAVVAHRLSATGAEWADVFGRLNSGTYNNEWLVIDYDRVDAAGVPGPGTLTVVDQIPGFVAVEDVTYMLLQQGYFPSYNIAWNPFIFNMSGNQADVEQFGPWFSYNDTARAQIFRRDAPAATDEAAFRRLVRYNDFTHDPISRQGCTADPPFSAENAIAARDDLNPADGNYTIAALGHRDHAAIDAKYTTAALRRASGGGRRSVGAVIQAGPTYDTQPAFNFLNTTLTGLPHAGLPDVWRMPWVQYSPATLRMLQ